MKLFFYLMICFYANALYSQTSINSLGGDIVNSNGTIAFSIGQIVYTTNTDGIFNIEQGVQHPFELYSLNIDENILNVSINVFPNPFSDKIIIEVLNDYRLLYFSIYDLNGKVLKEELITKNQISINTEKFESSIYFLKIFNKNNSNNSKTIKLIKK